MNKTEVREQMERVLREQAASGLTKKMFCEQHGINPARFYYWQRRLREETVVDTGQTAFRAITLRQSGSLEICLPGGTRLSWNGDNVEQLAALLRAIDKQHA